MRQVQEGFTLIEVVVVMAVAAILLAVAGVGLMGYVNRLRLDQDLSLAAGAFRAAVSDVRRTNTTATLTISGKTMTLSRGATTVQTVTLGTAPETTCDPSCTGTSKIFTLTAPFGRNDQDVSLKFAQGGRERTLLVRGPLALVGFQ